MKLLIENFKLNNGVCVKGVKMLDKLNSLKRDLLLTKRTNI